MLRYLNVRRTSEPGPDVKARAIRLDVDLLDEKNLWKRN